MASTSTSIRPVAPTAADDAQSTPAPSGRSASSSSRATGKAWACLVVADNTSRRERLGAAAKKAGWSPISCGSIGEALRESGRWRTQLTVLDLGVMPAVHKSAYLQFASQIASRERLLFVSDEPTADAPDAELWARQAGAWLYLASPDLEAGVAPLLAEARAIVEKLRKTTTPAVSADPACG